MHANPPNNISSDNVEIPDVTEISKKSDDISAGDLDDKSVFNKITKKITSLYGKIKTLKSNNVVIFWAIIIITIFILLWYFNNPIIFSIINKFKNMTGGESIKNNKEPEKKKEFISNEINIDNQIDQLRKMQETNLNPAK
jgi:hypothetical protein